VFYDNLQKFFSVYLLPLMPFDAINLRLGFEGLCPPGPGIHHSAEICHALMEVLPRLLPTSNRVTTAISMTRAEMAMDLHFFGKSWHCWSLVLTRPSKSRLQCGKLPRYLEFCHAYLLYYRLQAKLGFYHDERQRSCTFLRALQHMDYVDVVTILQTHVETYMDSRVRV
jgi:hypothetical protein